MSIRQREGRRAFLRTAGGLTLVGSVSDAEASEPEPGHRITAVTLIHGLPGKEQDLRQHLLSLSGPTRAEAGCVTYDLYQSPDQSHEFMRYEVWTSLEALEVHKKMPHLRASFEKRQREGWTTQITVWKRVPE